MFHSRNWTRLTASASAVILLQVLCSKQSLALVSPSRQGLRVPLSLSSHSASSLISPSQHWANFATLSLSAALAQKFGAATTIGKLLGAPISAMALTFLLSSLPLIPDSNGHWRILLPPGGSTLSDFLQSTSLTLATPLLLLGTSVRGGALARAGCLLGSFGVASVGSLLGAVLALWLLPALPLTCSIVHALPNGEGIKIAAALLAKNIGGGINYMAVCSSLNAAPESVVAGLCVDNVMALVYFPLSSLISSRWKDVEEEEKNVEKEKPNHWDEHSQLEDMTLLTQSEEDKNNSSVECLSQAIAIASILTAIGHFFNSKLHSILQYSHSSSLNLSLPITTLLSVLFSSFYPPNWFLSPTSTTKKSTILFTNTASNNLAKAGNDLGNALLYLFIATAGAPGWRLQKTVQHSFPSIATFLLLLYSIHLLVLWIFHTGVHKLTSHKHPTNSLWKKMAAPQRLLTASSAAIGGPATAAALVQSHKWESLLTPSLLVGNVGYAVATFVGLMFYQMFL